MRLLDGDKQLPLHIVQLYLTPGEAAKLRDALTSLLVDPEANAHEHIPAEDGARELSVSVVTETKLRNVGRYSKAEQKMFTEQ